MAKYTIELYKLAESDNFTLFDFDYELYDNDLKPIFEKFFVDYFYFNEIGFETIGRFKKALQNKLNCISYKYKEYYKTIIVQETKDFMNTKELHEETTRIINNTSTGIGTNTSIFSATPKQSIEDIERYMTSANKDRGENTLTNNGSETLTFDSSGNLGVSSDGFLLEKWREIIVDINEKICKDELSELFMLVY